MIDTKLGFMVVSVLLTASCSGSGSGDYESERKRYEATICSSKKRDQLLGALSELRVEAYERKDRRIINAVVHFDPAGSLVSQSLTIVVEYDSSHDVTRCEVKLVATGP